MLIQNKDTRTKEDNKKVDSSHSSYDYCMRHVKITSFPIQEHYEWVPNLLLFKRSFVSNSLRDSQDTGSRRKKLLSHTKWTTAKAVDLVT